MKPGTFILIIVISIMVLIVSLRSCEDEDYFEDTEIENSTDTIVETIPEFPYGKQYKIMRFRKRIFLLKKELPNGLIQFINLLKAIHF